MKPTLLRRLSVATAALLALTALPAMAQLSVDVTGEIDSNVKVAVPPMPAQPLHNNNSMASNQVPHPKHLHLL